MTLELKQITKSRAGEIHVHPTDLRLEAGGFNVLLGNTLAGKTSLINLMAGLDKPTSGQVWFNGNNVTGVSVQKRNISVVYQQFINYPGLSVSDNIASPLRVSRMRRDEIRRRVGEMAELMKISELLDRRPSELSGGQQQRTAMARALVKDSDLILLDEPLANLDFKLREELREELPRIFAGRNCVVVYATTEPTEALLLGEHTAALHEGRVVDFGPTTQIYRMPSTLISAAVLSEPHLNTINVHKQDDRIIANENLSWPADTTLPDGSYTVGLRPHHVSPVKVENRVAIEGKVLVAELSGSESTIHFEACGNGWVSLSHGVHPFPAGSRVTLYADVSQCFYFDSQGSLVASPNPPVKG